MNARYRPFWIKTLIAAAAIFWFGSQTLQAAEMRWAYVDLQTAMRTVEKGKKIKTKLETLKDQKEKEIEKDKDSLRNSGEELKKQQSVLSQDALMRKNKELAQKQFELEQKAQSYQMELMETQKEYADDLLTEMAAVIKDIATKEGYDVVFEKSGSTLLYADSKRDLTTKVVQSYNQKYGSDLPKPKKK